MGGANQAHIDLDRLVAGLANSAGHAFPNLKAATLDFLSAEADGCDDGKPGAFLTGTYRTSFRDDVLPESFANPAAK